MLSNNKIYIIILFYHDHSRFIIFKRKTTKVEKSFISIPIDVHLSDSGKFITTYLLVYIIP